MGRGQINSKHFYSMCLAVLSLNLMALSIVIPQIAYAAVKQYALVSTVAPDYSSSAHSLITVDPTGGPRTVQNNLLPTLTSDTTIVGYGSYFYRLERFQSDSLTKFSVAQPDTALWQFSTMDQNDSVTSSNPYDLIFLNQTKAYLIRYGTPISWIVNPSVAADAQDNFKTGTLDLSDYADQDGIPEASSGIIVDQKLFIILQRLDRNNSWTPNTAYIAVIDTTTDKEIDTGNVNEGGILGIPLPIKNPNAIVYVAANQKIYVQGHGKYESSWSGTPAEYSGGIVSIDPSTYETTMVLDDGDATSHAYGNISGMAIHTPTQGYFIGYNGWGDNTLYGFDPSTGSVSGEVNQNLTNINIAGMNGGVNTDINGMLWVCNASDGAIIILNTLDNSIDETISTSLNPQKVIFLTVGQEDDDHDGDGVPDAQEITGTVDLDGDGNSDVFADDYKGLNNVYENLQIGIKAGDNVESILTFQSTIADTALQDTTGAYPASMAYGFLDFSLKVPTGGTGRVTLYFSEPISSADRWYKYDTTSGWQDYSDYATFSADRKSVVLTLQDGGRGDADGQANGIIVDPCGPGTPPSTDDDSSSCFIDAVNNQKFAQNGLLLCAMLLLVGVALSRRWKLN